MSKKCNMFCNTASVYNDTLPFTVSEYKFHLSGNADRHLDREA